MRDSMGSKKTKQTRKETRTTEEKEYVLGTQEKELLRLGFQHQVWRSQAFGLWERAGFQSGQRLLDVGAGPGFTTRDLASIAGPKGSVIALDASQRFLDYVQSHPKAAESAAIETQLGDVQDIRIPKQSLDGAYARWVLCFVSHPEKVIAGLAKACKPGAVVAIQDYSNYTSMRICPKSVAFQKVIQAVEKSWRDSGGDPDVGTRLPSLLVEYGFSVREIRPLVRIGRPGSMLWKWPETFFANYVPRLLELGLLSQNDAKEFQQDWDARTQDPGSYFITPTLVEIIAVRNG